MCIIVHIKINQLSVEYFRLVFQFSYLNDKNDKHSITQVRTNNDTLFIQN